MSDYVRKCQVRGHPLTAKLLTETPGPGLVSAVPLQTYPTNPNQ